MCDDLIVSDVVDNGQIEQILDYMDNHNINFCRLNPLDIGNKIDELPLLRNVNKRTPYAVNLQIGIFNTEFFKKLLGTGEMSAWDIEKAINDEASVAKDKYFEDVVAVSKYVIPYIHGVYKGMWKRLSVKKIIKRGIDINIQRPYVPLKLELKIFLIGWLQYKLSPGLRLFFKRFIR